MIRPSPRHCPTCGARPGERCVTKAEGKPAPLHVDRITCPKCGCARVDAKCWNCDWTATPGPERSKT